MVGMAPAFKTFIYKTLNLCLLSLVATNPVYLPILSLCHLCSQGGIFQPFSLPLLTSLTRSDHIDCTTARLHKIKIINDQGSIMLAILFLKLF